MFNLIVFVYTFGGSASVDKPVYYRVLIKGN